MCAPVCLCLHFYYLIYVCTLAYSCIHTLCAPVTTVCLFHCVLPSRNCCYAKCSHLVVKHSCGFSPSLSVSPPLHRGTSLGLWCSSCLVQVFSASSLQSLPQAPRGLLGRIIHILSTLPHTILFQMAGPGCLSERLSAKFERMCVY